MSIHNIHIAVDEKEYNELMKVKGSKTWHDLIMNLTKG